jgi:hypothetical protein
MAKTPKDFSGKNKTKDTYDKDWVFHDGAWQTKKQRKSAIAGQKEAKAYLAGINGSAPTSTMKPPSIGGTGTMVPIPGSTGPSFAPGNKPLEITGTGNTPAWWMGQAIANPDENQAFANAANAIMPLLSPEDAMNMGGYLATNYKDQFGQYANLKLPIPTELTNERNQYLSSQRAQQAVSLLNRMQTAAGGDQSRFGKGYDFLRNAINLLNKFQTNGSPMTREQYAQFQNAFQGLQSGAGKDIQAYANLAQMFSLPSFTAGPLVSNNPNAKLIP